MEVLGRTVLRVVYTPRTRGVGMTLVSDAASSGQTSSTDAALLGTAGEECLDVYLNTNEPFCVVTVGVQV